MDLAAGSGNVPSQPSSIPEVLDGSPSLAAAPPPPAVALRSPKGSSAASARKAERDAYMKQELEALGPRPMSSLGLGQIMHGQRPPSPERGLVDMGRRPLVPPSQLGPL